MIVVYNADGVRGNWQQDRQTQREWDQWRQKRVSVDADERREQAREARESSAPMISADKQGRRVSLDEIEDDPQQYLGQTISVDAEVQEVLGPHVFKIDEVNWADLTREVLVFMPAELVALVRENDRVTVTGTLRSFARAQIHREMDWLDFDQDVEVSLSRRPVLIASRVVVGATAADPDGFFIRSADQHVFVLTPQKSTINAKPGETVSIEGVVLAMPRDLARKLTMPDNANDTIYVYATEVKNSDRR